MDVDMIKSSASTALHHHHHHDHDQNQNHHHHLDMMSIMMQMSKPISSSPQVQLSEPNSTFLDINFSEPIHQPSMVSPNSFTGLTNPNYHPRSLFKSSSAMDNNNNYPYEKRSNSMAAMREMIFRIAAMQPIHIDPESIKPPKRRNVKISKDPQSVAARHRRERISERIRILQRLVPGGTKMDTASMLDEAIHYVKFLKKQVQTLEQAGVGVGAGGFPVAVGQLTGAHQSTGNNYSAFLKANNCQPAGMLNNASTMVESIRMLR